MGFQHYPKYVKSLDGDMVLVNDEDEELEVAGEVVKSEEHTVYVEPATKQTQDEFEYPKYIDGTIVNNADEELELLGVEEADEEPVPDFALGDGVNGLDSDPTLTSSTIDLKPGSATGISTESNVGLGSGSAQAGIIGSNILSENIKV